jgi:hypothetical protein
MRIVIIGELSPSSRIVLISESAKSIKRLLRVLSFSKSFSSIALSILIISQLFPYKVVISDTFYIKFTLSFPSSGLFREIIRSSAMILEAKEKHSSSS